MKNKFQPFNLDVPNFDEMTSGLVMCRGKERRTGKFCQPNTFSFPDAMESAADMDEAGCVACVEKKPRVNMHK